MGQLAEIMDKAADYIEEHGWCQNTLMTRDGRVCIQGALHEAVGDKVSEVGGDLKRQHSLFDDANRAITEQLVERSTYFHSHHWNDARGRTKEEVIELLRTTAKELANKNL